MKKYLLDTNIISYLDDPLINLSAESAQIFGNVKSMYKENIGIGRKELDRHNIDFILAASAITKKAVMVSNDSIFEKIKGIYPDFQFENWTQL
ncbi:MAG: hypothetical protein HQK98_08875 [Nitrospirae bacterium]|nr:hypothetical protein [Nitrospirota bacterium]